MPDKAYSSAERSRTTMTESRRPAATLALAATVILSSDWLLCSAFTPLRPSAGPVPIVHHRVALAPSLQAVAETAAELLAVATSGEDEKETKTTPNPNQNKNKKKKGKKMEMKLTVTDGDKKKKKRNGAKGKGGQRFTKKKSGKKPKPLKPMSDLIVGSKINGVVAGLSDFGAFVKTDYAIKKKDDPTRNSGYALLHKSQISDEKIDDIAKVMRVGDRIKNARVVNVNYAKGEVGLSLRKPREGRRSVEDIKVGDELDGKVTSVTAYGAFVDIGAKKNALLHISRITQDKVTNIRHHVNEGDWVTIHIIEKDAKKQTLACSMLDENADDYINRRQRRMRKRKSIGKAERVAAKAGEGGEEKTEIEFFEEAIRELEESLSAKAK